jgi:hypothetical protein
MLSAYPEKPLRLSKLLIPSDESTRIGELEPPADQVNGTTVLEACAIFIYRSEKKGEINAVRHNKKETETILPVNK